MKYRTILLGGIRLKRERRTKSNANVLTLNHRTRAEKYRRVHHWSTEKVKSKSIVDSSFDRTNWWTRV